MSLTLGELRLIMAEIMRDLERRDKAGLMKAGLVVNFRWMVEAIDASAQRCIEIKARGGKV